MFFPELFIEFVFIRWLTFQSKRTRIVSWKCGNDGETIWTLIGDNTETMGFWHLVHKSNFNCKAISYLSYDTIFIKVAALCKP